MNFRFLFLLFVLGFFRHRSRLILYRIRRFGAPFPEAPNHQLRHVATVSMMISDLLKQPRNFKPILTTGSHLSARDFLMRLTQSSESQQYPSLRTLSHKDARNPQTKCGIIWLQEPLNWWVCYGWWLETWDACGNCEGSGYIDAKDSGGRLFGGSSSIAGDKIKRMEPYSGHAGLKAFLSALGIELPSETQ
jgi:hypothetical protein